MELLKFSFEPIAEPDFIRCDSVIATTFPVHNINKYKKKIRSGRNFSIGLERYSWVLFGVRAYIYIHTYIYLYLYVNLYYRKHSYLYIKYILYKYVI